MSEENTEGTENEITPEQIETAANVLKTQGYHVIDQDKMSQRLAKERSKPERELTALREKFEALEASNKDLKQFRKGIEDKDKSELELWEGKEKAWLKDTESKQAELQQAMDDLTAERKKNSDFQVKMRLRTMLTDPIDEDVALMWAMNKIPGLSVNDSGDLVFTEPTGVIHEGPAAEKVVSDWWGEQTTLQRPKTPGPDTRGNSKAPTPQSNEYKPLDQHADLADRLEHAKKHNPVIY